MNRSANESEFFIYLFTISYFWACVSDYMDFFRRLIRVKGGRARSVMVIVVGNGHGDMSLNPGRG